MLQCMRIAVVVACAAMAGCGYQMSLHAGPRVDAEGRVGVEFGATMGAAVFPNKNARRTGAIVASVEGAPYVTTDSDCHACTTARGAPMSTSSKVQGRAAVRGMLEWVEEANTAEARYVRAPGVARRFGAYLGVDMDEDERLGLVGVTAGVSPWVWGFHGRASDHWLALGVRLASELIPGETDGHRVVVRALVQADVVFRDSRSSSP